VVDTAYCGRLGPSALASLGPCVSLFHLSFSTFGALRGTTTALIAGALAQSDAAYQLDPTNAAGKRRAAQVAQVSLGLSLVLGSGVLLGLACFGNAALSAMGLPLGSPLQEPASNYLRVRVSCDSYSS
jgi:Na+-driven multidrug efflux pump